jgi:acetylornithine deacetylase/succinyl-diaminopimelate desuccinylase-like protein
MRMADRSALPHPMRTSSAATTSSPGSSKGGISHNPREFTADDDLVAGANILLDVVSKLAQEE